MRKAVADRIRYRLLSGVGFEPTSLERRSSRALVGYKSVPLSYPARASLTKATSVSIHAAATEACVAQKNGVGNSVVAALVGKASPQQVDERPGNALLGFTDRQRSGRKPRGIGALTRRVPLTGRLSAACLPLLLAACQTPAVQTRTVEVKIPVAVQPIKPAQVPAVPAPLGPRPQSLSAAADKLLSKWCEAVGYMLRADPLLRVSAGMQQQALGKFPECER